MFAELPHHPQRDDTPPYLPSPDTCSNTANCGGDQQRRKTEETHRRSARVHRSRRQRIQQYSLPRRRVSRDCAFETRTAKKAKCPSDYKEKKKRVCTRLIVFFFLRKGNEERRGFFFGSCRSCIIMSFTDHEHRLYEYRQRTQKKVTETSKRDFRCPQKISPSPHKNKQHQLKKPFKFDFLFSSSFFLFTFLMRVKKNVCS